MESHEKVLALKAQFGLEALDTTQFEYRHERWTLVGELLKFDGHMVISAPTGTGKTVLFLLKAVQIIAQGGRAVFATVRRHLVDQFVQQAYQFTTLSHDDVLGITGEIIPTKRADLYQKRPSLIIATREALVQDMKRRTFLWDGIQLFGTDEVHHSQGKDAYTELLPILKKHPVQRLHVSATLAHDESRLISLLYDLAADRIFYLDAQREILQEEAITVDLDDELNWAASIIQTEGIRCQKAIENSFPHQQLRLFDPYELATDVSHQHLPGYTERQEMRNRIKHLDPDSVTCRYLLSKWCELGLICWLYEGLVTCGRFVFLEDFAHRYAKHRITPVGVFVRDLERGSPKGSRAFERRVVSNNRLWMVFARLAHGTPYQAFVDGRSWQHVLQRTQAAFSRHELASHAANFFDSALEDMAKRAAFDHPKMSPFLEILHQHPQHLRGGKVIVFTGTRRHAHFLTAWLNQRSRKLNYHAVAAVGPRNAQQRRVSKRSLADFRSEKANILISTDYVREGLDVPLAQVCVEYLVPDSNPIKKVQGSGRVGRDIMHEMAYLYHLLTRQNNEINRLQAARRRIKHMQRATRRRGELIVPDEEYGGVS